MTARHLGLAPLSALTVPPPRLVELAAAAGFDFVGLRVRAVTDHEPDYDLSPGSPLARETLARLAHTGLTVRDVEFLLLDGTRSPRDWLPMLEAGAGFEAKTLTVAVSDPEPDRVLDTLARLTEDARAYGITPSVEPISYQAVASFPDAARLATATGAAVLVDTLHAARCHASNAQLTDAAPLTSMIQLCDAPAVAPLDRDGLVAESRACRLAPGDGELDLAGMLGAVDRGRPGQSPLPVSVEAPHDVARRERGDAAWIRHLHDAARRVLTSAPDPSDAKTTSCESTPTGRTPR